RQIVGIHTTSPQNYSKLGTIEVDIHDGPTPNHPRVNERAIRPWYDRARSLGFHPLLWDSNGKGAVQLDLVCEQPAPPAPLRWFRKEFVSDVATYGLPKQPEALPKQPGVSPDPNCKGHYGNFCRLVGRHRTRDYWATVWNGQAWLAGMFAINHILSLTG